MSGSIFCGDRSPAATLRNPVLTSFGMVLVLVGVTTTIVVFAMPPLSRQAQELVRSGPNVWQGIRSRIESLTQNYPAVREALPRTDEIAVQSVDADRAGVDDVVARLEDAPG